jgi:dihydrofolate reductase
MIPRKLILYISMSLDGFIATNDDDLSWLSIVQKGAEDYGYEAFNQTVDTYIVGRKTYDVVLKLTGGSFPAADRHKCYVITREERATKENIAFYNGDIETLIETLKAEEGKNIYCDGGGQIVKMLMEKNLIDEYIISVIPIVLGDGKRLFTGQEKRFNLTTKSAQQFESGLVQLHYVRN